MAHGLVAVAPTAPEYGGPNQRVIVSVPRPWLRGLRGCSRALIIGLLRGWARLQVSRSGKYSLTRLAQFHAYAASSSPVHCLLVCLATPVPSLLFVVLLESMALKPPRDWQSDLTIWLRMGITTTIMGFSYALQFRQVIPELPVSSRRAAAIGFTTSLMYVGFLALLSYLWTFPIPFGFVVTAAPYGLFLFISMIVFVGPAPLRGIPRLGAKVRQLAHVLTVQSLLVYIYPVYTAVFVWLGAEHQPLFLVCLPLIKLLVKNLNARACVGTALEDQLPEITVFSVELFNALYLTACVSVSGSVQQSMAVIVITDVVQQLVSVRSILARARRMRGKADEQHQRDLTALSQRSDDPKADVDTDRTPTTNIDNDLRTITQKLHFSCEYLVLVEYIELFIPGICMLYTALLAQLPNAQFYPQMRDPQLQAQQRVAQTTIALYVAFKVISLLLLGALLKRRLRVHALYQLAFVLERQATMIQAKLFVWVTYSLTFRLEHSGMDFAVIAAFLGE